MDPKNRGPEGYDTQGPEQGPRPVGLPEPDAPAPGGPAPARVVQVVSGDLLVTVNPVDGSEVEPCPPTRRPASPAARYSAAERAELGGAGRAVRPGAALAPLPLLDRQEERGRVVRLLARGRSVRLTGLAGAGRSALLDAVADDCVGFAPDGVVRLSGHRRTPRELLYELYRTVYRAEDHRPAPEDMAGQLDTVGAIVVVDDLEFGGDTLDELLDATPECAFIVACTPDVPGPSPEAQLEEVFLAGLSRGGSLDLLGRATGRPLTDDETQWAGDLWFESGGLPVRFVRAGALLRGATGPDAAPGEPAPPLPSVADVSAPAVLLAAGLGESARAVLRLAVALGGEVPHQAQLPALVDDPHAENALAELLQCALITPVGGRYRLAHGVQAELEAARFVTAAGSAELLEAAGGHYAWWAGHQAVASTQVLAQSDALLAALAALVVRATAAAQDGGGTAGELAVKLARTAAPALAAGLDFGSWERALRAGQEAARLTGEVAQEAYFHHELGVLALCLGRLDRARAELEASIGLRGALADRRGTVAGRRALALVEDRSGDLPGVTPPLGLPAVAAPPPADGPALPVPAPAVPQAPQPPTSLTPAAAAAAVAAFDALDAAEAPAAADEGPATLVARAPGDGQGPAEEPPLKHRRRIRTTRRNLVSAGAGAVLAAVLGTVVTLGATSDSDTPSDHVGTSPSVSDDDDEGGASAADPPHDTSASPSTSKKPKHRKEPSDSPSASTSGGSTAPGDEESGSGGGSRHGSGGSSGGSHHSSGPSSKPPSHHTSKPPSDPDSPPPDDPTSPPPDSDEPTDPGSPTDEPSDPPSSDADTASQTAPVGSDDTATAAVR
ncbi:ATP-binding protein [Streptomyces sp. NPDC050560]|uniref:ATP-binding protein n=1 Tax=Streptomyces sp. NPDC050560 TaxID=3365630 RepID=UPI0037A8E7AB